MEVQMQARNTQHAPNGIKLDAMQYVHSAGCEQHVTPVHSSYDKGTTA
jgi:hypothetical protein